MTTNAELQAEVDELRRVLREIYDLEERVPNGDLLTARRTLGIIGAICESTLRINTF